MPEKSSVPEIGSEPYSDLKNFHAEAWHTPRGRAIREVIFGLNDGLITTLGFLAGITGSIVNGHIIILAALAEMVAGAISMSSGAYISSKSQREFFQREIEREKSEIEEDPDHEKAEIREIYAERGFNEEEIDILVRRITADKEQWLRFMLREELGLGNEVLESPVKIGITMGLSFLAGSVVPLLPYLFFVPKTGLIISTICSVIFLFALGALKTRLTKKSWIRSGAEMLLIGMGSAVIGFVLGLIVSNMSSR